MKRRQLVLASAAAGLGLGVASRCWAKPIAGDDPDFYRAPRLVRAYNPHTGQGGDYVYWYDGAYDMDQYVALSALMLDHRELQAVQMHPLVFDVMYAVQRYCEQAAGLLTQHILTSGYRTARTNRKVAGSPYSYHLKGWAGDGVLNGVSHAQHAQLLRLAGAGGVGLYPKHVHWDAGPVRGWVSKLASE